MTKLEELIEKLCPDGVEYKELSEVLTIKNGKDYKHFGEGNVPVYGSGGIMTYIDTAVYEKPSVLIPRKGSLDKLYFVQEPFWTVDTIFYTDINADIVEPKYIFYYLQKEHLEKLNKAGGVPSLTQSVLNKVKLPVPPLEVQREIVRILDNFTFLTTELAAELAARQTQYEYYRDLLLTFKPNESTILNERTNELELSGAIRWMKLGDIGSICMCKRILKSETNQVSGIPFYKIGTFGKQADAYISDEKFAEYKSRYKFPQKGDILISAAGTIGRTVVYDGEPAYFQDSNIVWIDNDETKVLNTFLNYWYSTSPWVASTGGTISRLYNDNIAKAPVPVPPLEVQQRIVDILDRFDTLCNDISSGLPAEIEMRQKQYEYYRDKLLTFKELKKEA